MADPESGELQVVPPEEETEDGNEKKETALEQIRKIYRAIPFSAKILMAAAIGLIVIGLLTMIIMGRQPVYQPVYSDLNQEEAAEMMATLKDANIQGKVEEGVLSVPLDQVDDARLKLAEAGLPRGEGVGFEIFDKKDWGATDFEIKVNYQRALQGELERTIQKFDEVENARVLIVLPKESVFIEESKPASASVQLKLTNKLNREKVAAIVHLVASAVTDLKAADVTVVDTSGRILTQEPNEAEQAGELATRQVKFRQQYEQDMAKRIQTLLEGVVGEEKAIVRVTAEMDFDRVDINEEVFNPDEQVARSEQIVNEKADRSTGPYGYVSSVNPVVPPGTPGATRESTETTEKANRTVNYEISRTVRHTIKPMMTLSRLSVAAVLDSKYKYDVDKNGNTTKIPVERTDAELERFRGIVQRAMGYSANREDQVSVESFPFWTEELEKAQIPAAKRDLVDMALKHWYLIFLVVLVLVAYLLLVRPIVKTVKEIRAPEETPILPEPEEAEGLLPGEDKEALPEPVEMSPRERMIYLAQQDVDRAANIVRTWLRESYI